MTINKKDASQHLQELGLNQNEIKVYTALTQLGEAPASRVAKKANLPRTTAISILEKFRHENYVSTHKYKGVTYYWIESPQVLSESFLTKAAVAKELGAMFSDLYRTEAHFPYAEIHDTTSSIRKFIEKTIANLKPKSVIYTIDTPNEGNYNKIYSENIENIILSGKKKKDVHTFTLVPHGSFATIASSKLKSQNIVIRELPINIRFNGSLWIVENTIVHFSGNPPFVVALKHENITKGIKGLFDFLWEISVPQKSQ